MATNPLLTNEKQKEYFSPSVLLNSLIFIHPKPNPASVHPTKMHVEKFSNKKSDSTLNFQKRRGREYI